MARASIIGRLLGLKILRLEADVTLLPASLAPIEYVEPVPRPITAADGGTLSDAAELLARASKTIRESTRYRI